MIGRNPSVEFAIRQFASSSICSDEFEGVTLLGPPRLLAGSSGRLDIPMMGKVIFQKVLSQRQQAPLLPILVDGVDRQVELLVGHLFDPKRVCEGGGRLRVGSLEHRDGR